MPGPRARASAPGGHAPEWSHDIHWPVVFAPADADLFPDNPVSIDAPCPKAWRRIVATEKRPGWYPNSPDLEDLDDRTGMQRNDSRPGRGTSRLLAFL